MKTLAVLVACLALLPQAPRAAQAQEPDAVGTLLGRLEEALESGARERYLDLLSGVADRKAAEEFAAATFQPGVTRATVRERDRGDLLGALPGAGYRLLVEVLCESGSRARLSTWRLDVRRRSGTDGVAEEWGIAFQEPVTSLSGLFRLALNPRKQYGARDLVITSEDLRLTMTEGSVFVAEPDGGTPTGLVLLGRGEMSFAPAPASERGQLRIFAGAEILQVPFESVFLRVNPNDLYSFIPREALVEKPVDPREFRRAEEIFRQDMPKSFGIDLGDMSADHWSLLPGMGDVLAEVRTRRFDVLTYARSASEVEDIALFDRRNRRNISSYSSKVNASRFGRFYDEDDRTDYVVKNYDIEASFNPSKRYIQGRVRMAIEIASGTNSLSFRLAEPLVIESIVSNEFGRLPGLRIRNQNAVIVTLPATLTPGYPLSLTVAYSGVLPPQGVDREILALTAGPQIEQEVTEIPVEDSVLYSNRSYWYPQPGIQGYARATMRLTVPAPYSVVASADPVTVVTRGDQRKGPVVRQFHFETPQPARYFSCVITRLEDVRSEKVHIGNQVDPYRAGRRPGVYYDDVKLNVWAQPRLAGRARDVGKTAADLIRFYSGLVGDCPYPTLSIALTEGSLPGGHSPAYMAVVAQPSIGSRLNYHADPAAFSDYPEYFLAHEIAHQWWGQGVGWKNYHEQWLSEGFAQYFAVLYAEKVRGREAAAGLLRRMRRWAMDRSDEGAIYLGYRVGHIKSDSRMFRAVVYNKSAVVLHMLRRLIGDEAFFRGVRRFYDATRFQKAGTDDLRRAMEAEAGRSLERFFEGWVHGQTLPQVTLAWRLEQLEGRSEAVVRLEHTGELFDLPLTVTLDYLERPAVNLPVKLIDRTVELRVPVVGKLRSVTANRDELSVVEVK